MRFYYRQENIIEYFNLTLLKYTANYEFFNEYFMDYTRWSSYLS